MASFSLLTKVLADFLSVIYLLTLLLNHATNHIQIRQTVSKLNKFVENSLHSL